MSDAQERPKLDQTQVVALLLQRKVITEAQLKAAIDYQKSVGGEIVDILFNLGLVRSNNLDELVKEARDTSDRDEVEQTKSLNPDDIDVSELRIHHKQCDKLPAELLQRFQAVLFFPVSKVGSRRLIVGHGKEIPADMVHRVHRLLGVEVCSLALSESDAARFLNEYLERKSPRKPKPATHPKPATPPKLEKSEKPQPLPEADPEPHPLAGDGAPVPMAKEIPPAPTPMKVVAPPMAKEVVAPPMAKEVVATPMAKEVVPPPLPTEPKPPRSADVEVTRTADLLAEGFEENGLLGTALIGLLIKKNLITKEELQVEYSLLRKELERA